MKRFTELRNGVPVIPLRNAVCGIDMPYWTLFQNSANESFLSGDAVDALASYEANAVKGTDFLDAVDTVCVNCHFCSEESCSKCPVRMTVEAIEGKAINKKECDLCNGEYHTETIVRITRFHTGNSATIAWEEPKFCPRCGRKIAEEK